MGCGSSSNAEVTHPKFLIAKDYTEIEGHMSGEGVKATKAWEATITPSLLQSKRQEFWQNYRGHNRSSCLYLKQAAEADAATAKLLLEMSGFVLENGTMNVCISPSGHRYELPPFILTDPVKFKDPNMPQFVKKEIKETIIKVKLRTVFTVSEDIFEVNNTMTGHELKSLFLEKNKNHQEIRLFFGGKEINDEKRLIDFGIESEMVVQVYKKPLEKSE